MECIWLLYIGFPGRARIYEDINIYKTKIYFFLFIILLFLYWSKHTPPPTTRIVGWYAVRIDRKHQEGRRTSVWAGFVSLVRVGPTWTGASTLGKRTRFNPAYFLIASITTIEATTREPQREATGKISAPSPAEHTTAYPSGGASSLIVADSTTTIQPDRCADPRKSRLIITKHQDTLKTSIAPTPSLFRCWRIRHPFAHPRYPESDSF